MKECLHWKDIAPSLTADNRILCIEHPNKSTNEKHYKADIQKSIPFPYTKYENLKIKLRKIIST
jgi:hypothetical protein